MCTYGVKNASVNWWAANLRSLFTYAMTSYALTRSLKSYSPLISIIDKITKRRVVSPVLLKINKYTCTCVRWGRRRKTVAWLYFVAILGTSAMLTDRQLHCVPHLQICLAQFLFPHGEHR